VGAGESRMRQDDIEKFDLAAVGRRLRSEFAVEGAAIPATMQALLARLSASKDQKPNGETTQLAQ
jgi:hypothetical protein